MALSYEDSLNAQNAQNMKSTETTEVKTEETLVATASVMSLDDDVSALAETEEETWIKSDRYLWYDDFDDDKISVVDELKNIKLDPTQVNLSQEESSQYMPFEMSRRYDNFDLALNARIQFHYVNKEGEEDYVNAINVSYTEDKIRFALLVPYGMTYLDGKVSFEIVATGTNSKGENYKWISKPCKDLEVLKSLSGNGIVDPTTSDWYTQFVRDMDAKITEAQNYAQEAQAAIDTVQTLADQAQASADQAQSVVDSAKSELAASVGSSISTSLSNYYTKQEVIDSISSSLSTSLENYYTKEEVDALMKEIDLSAVYEAIDNIDGLANFNTSYDSDTRELSFYNGEALIKTEVLNSDPSIKWVTAYDAKVDSKISEAVSTVQNDLDAYKTATDADLQAIHTNIDELPETLQTDYYTKEDTDALLEEKAEKSTVTNLSSSIANVESSVNTNKSNITALGTKISDLETTVEGIDTSPRVTYEATYDEDQIYTLWEIEGEGDDEVRTPKGQFKIQGGGGASTSSVLKIEYVTKTPLVVTVNDKILITYNFSGTDSSGDVVMEGVATWKVGSTVVATNTAVSGENTFDITDYISTGTQKVTLSITDDAGSLVTKSWTVQKIDVRLESSFNDKLTYPVDTLSFDYTPYGSVSKEVHFILDGVELPSVTTSSSGIPMAYSIPAQGHGSHLLEVYLTAEVNNNIVESNHILKDIIFYDSFNESPVISCVQQKITAKQYDTTNITYTVYDPKTETPKVTLAVDDVVVSTLTMSENTQVWQYKTSDIGDHVLTITCRDTVKTLYITIEKLDIDVEPITANLVFDFNPTGKTNNDEDRLWTDGTTSMTVSDNFDWVNGGYQLDENGDQYFAVKAGTTATIDYNLFADDARKNGKEFKIIFKTTNVSRSDATFLTCLSDSIGIQMNVHEAYINSSLKSLYAPYSEEDIIEFDIDINKDSDISTVMTYEDGRPYRPMSYTSDHSFTQSSPVPIVIGSPDCDVCIYRMKAYSSSLTSKAILSNFIADARTADEMIARYNRNQIYDENNDLTPESVAKSHPNVKVIKIDCPHFTNDKKDFVINTSIECIHTGGDPVYDNWKATNCAHSGQGTTSNEYGEAGRNMDLLMCFDGVYQNSKIPFDENYKTVLTLGDGTTYEDGTGKVTLSRTSVPANYLNIKVNIASSENENNAIFQKRYNDYLPYTMPAQKRDSRVKNSMEFVDCVVFIRENDPDLTTHREFQDCEWHYYAAGNLGDSKKTDYSRVNDANDPKEFVVEIMDNTLPNSTFSDSEEALAALDADVFDEKGTYGFRYEMSGITDEQREANMAIWRNFYRFVATSSDEEFVSGLKDWFVVDSALYFYLFTERYTMLDNRGKNTFWHFSKVYISQEEADSLGDEANYYTIDDEAAAINDGYRLELWDYDNDTGLGINNSGELTMTYGKEDSDYHTDGDPSSGYVFNAAESKFFCRIRDLMHDELAAMYLKCESQGCWSSTSLINEFDSRQSNFSEAIWITDYERKYERTYREGNTRFLEQMMNGSKKYQRRQFERDQDPYIGTKYYGTSVTSDQIMFRCNTPVSAIVTPDYTLHLTPYSDMYLSVMFGATYRTQIRAKAGVEYDITCPFTTMDDTAVLIYCASRIQSMGDISACYIHDNDFSKATKLKVLTIGNETEGYANTFLTHLVLGNNTLLEKLDIRNTPNLSGCGNLQEFYAEGSGITGVVFATGGKLRIAHIPAIVSLTMKNLSYLEEVSIDGFDNLRTLIIENTPFIDTFEYVDSSPSLTNVRLIGIDWNTEDTSILDRLLTIAGIDNSGYNTSVSVLTGTYYSPVVKQKLLADYVAAWSDLEITYDTLVQQFTWTFVNDDEENTVLDVQYVDKGEKPVDPVTRTDNPISTPTKASSVSTDFTYSGWDTEFVSTFANMVAKATYTESVRKYTIKYASKGTVLQESTENYGTYKFYEDDTPTYTAEESAYKYYLFDRWDKSGFVDGDKTINAVYDVCEYNLGYFDGKDLSELRPVEIYAMDKLGLESDLITEKDSISFSLGNDYSFDDIEEKVLIDSKKVFTGSNYIDTEISLFDEDRDFVFAVDFTFDAANSANAVLAQCYQSNGSNGFRLIYNNGPKIAWGTSSATPASAGNREIMILRHIKGDNGLYVYTSNLAGLDINYTEISRTKSTTADSTLVFGCSKADDGAYENYATGTIYWSKLWYADLGDEACRSLAAYPHITETSEMCGFKRFYLSDNSSKRCSMTFLSTTLLPRTMQMSDSSTNTGGWTAASLNTYLNTRLMKAIPVQWRQLLKQVKISSSIGDKSTEISTSDCYIAIPAAIEVDPTMTAEPYCNEGTAISYMTTNALRKCSMEDGDPIAYWTRSPNVAYASYTYQVNADGGLYGYYSPNEYGGVRIMFSV